jgi:hypothetical protein
VTTNFTFDAGKRWRTEEGPSANPDEILYAYTGTGRLSSYTNETTGAQATYSYDSVGQRTQSVVTKDGVQTTTDFTYTGLALHKLEAEQKQAGTTLAKWTITYLYDEYGKPYASVYRDTTSA